VLCALWNAACSGTTEFRTSDVEAFAAPALALCIRVVELERFVQPVAREVQCRAVENLERLLVDHDLGVVRLEQRIVGPNLVRIVERVREAGATTFFTPRRRSTPLPRLASDFGICRAAFCVKLIATWITVYVKDCSRGYRGLRSPARGALVLELHDPHVFGPRFGHQLRQRDSVEIFQDLIVQARP
jgi:hypothetical protein